MESTVSTKMIEKRFILTVPPIKNKSKKRRRKSFLKKLWQ
jgi:hypothetical protein